MGIMDWITGATGLAEKGTGFGEWFGIFSEGKREDGTTRQDRWNTRENISDVADVSAKALQDGLQTHDIAPIGKTLLGAWVDEKFTPMVRNFLSKIPLLPAFVERGIASWLGNSAQDVTESISGAVLEKAFGENDVNQGQTNTKDIADRLGITGKYDELDGIGDNHVDATGKTVSPAAAGGKIVEMNGRQASSTG